MDNTAASAFSRADLAGLTRFVASKCPTRLSRYDVEDLVQTMLADAWETHLETGIPLAALAFSNAKRPRYYVRAGGRAGAMLREAAWWEHEGPRKRTTATEAEQVPDGHRFEAALDIEDLLERLDQREAMAVRLRLIGGATYEMAAEALGVSVGTVYTLTERGVTRLRADYLAATAA